MPQAMPGVAPPVSGFLTHGAFRTQSAARLAPIDACCAFDRPPVRRAHALCATVLSTCLRPTRHFAGPLSCRRRMPAAETFIIANVIPEDAIAACAVSLLHFDLPSDHARRACCRLAANDHGSTALTTASSAADQPPPSARIKPTLVCSRRVAIPIEARSASSAADCAVTTSR